MRLAWWAGVLRRPSLGGSVTYGAWGWPAMMTPEVEACNRDNVWAMLACGVKRKMASGRLRYSSVDVLTESLLLKLHSDSLGEALAWWRVVLTTEKDLSSLSPFVPPTILRQRLGAYAQLFLVGVGGAPIALSLVQWQPVMLSSVWISASPFLDCVG
uniref:Uncharacterized protein n=2 Tax=Oryza TaxID=4527 RepID=Q6H4Z4_ORYSJ|nr:hypothetical protein [Oryza sativa Japonica Group]BAD26205.1 hypothetical protein [Oryza sativa Japonica Group]